MCLTASCKVLRDVRIDDKTYRLENPPAMTQIGNNLFIDISEVSNNNYLFYVSDDHKNASPTDSTFHEYYADPTYYNLVA